MDKRDCLEEMIQRRRKGEEGAYQVICGEDAHSACVNCPYSDSYPCHEAIIDQLLDEIIAARLKIAFIA